MGQVYRRAGLSAIAEVFQTQVIKELSANFCKQFFDQLTFCFCHFFKKSIFQIKFWK